MTTADMDDQIQVVFICVFETKLRTVIPNQKEQDLALKQVCQTQITVCGPQFRISLHLLLILDIFYPSVSLNGQKLVLLLELPKVLSYSLV